eukprot:GHVU01142264.1.p1 GENE.GHVU01142264.1~~GHVU01142264.1.p1  ORF type:complete len:162 (+),score=28.26 GHVU01142264.1:280-765(+)
MEDYPIPTRVAPPRSTTNLLQDCDGLSTSELPFRFHYKREKEDGDGDSFQLSRAVKAPECSPDEVLDDDDLENEDLSKDVDAGLFDEDQARDGASDCDVCEDVLDDDLEDEISDDEECVDSRHRLKYLETVKVSTCSRSIPTVLKLLQCLSWYVNDDFVVE